MKYKNKIISVFLLSVVALVSASCAKQPAQNGAAQTPTEAYKNLYAAVKAKDTEKIKQSVSKETQNLAGFMADRQKQPIEKSYENGFTATTFADSLPEIRDERVKDNFGAVEVYNTKENRWEDLPYIMEDGGWKLAVGDLFKGTYQSPGKGKAQIENEAANVGMPLPATNAAPMPEFPKGKNPTQFPPPANDNKSSEPKSIEVPKEGKPKKVIDERQIGEILAQYKKHGWNLRRVLLSAQAKKNLPATLFGDAEIISSELEAAWFSRASIEGREAWELRRLSGAPFALVEVFDETDEEDVRTETRREMETILLEQASKTGSKKLPVEF